MNIPATGAEIAAVFRYTIFLICFLTLVYSLPQTPMLSFHQQKLIEKIDNTKALDALLEDHNIDLQNIDISKLSRQISATNLPEDLSKYPAQKRIKLFIGLVLPHIHSSNSAILLQRKKLIQYIWDIKNGIPISSKRQNWFKRLAQRYSGPQLTPEQLLERVDIIPASMALAQAITESGWGTSRFARQGNALYGQHLAKNSSGKFITSLYGNVKVAAFDSIYLATVSYMHNLNTSRAHKTLRLIRKEQRSKQHIPDGRTLAKGLKHYSELGNSYVNDIRFLIRKYKLDRFDTLQDLDKVSSVAIIFDRSKKSS